MRTHLRGRCVFKDADPGVLRGKQARGDPGGVPLADEAPGLPA